jgi:protein-S-isoprenylcysteine O-methyltransferase Ste14
MTSFLVFVLASGPILWVSWRSLRHPTSHGFVRFFAFEAVLALLVLNAPHWFERPLATRQVVSWICLTVSAVLVVWAVVLLHRRGESHPTQEGSPLYGWENTSTLVTTGVYRWIRHPMYASLLFLAWGALLKSVTAAALLLAVLATGALMRLAKVEETENLARFGQAYRDYCTRTSRFVPLLF